MAAEKSNDVCNTQTNNIITLSTVSKTPAPKYDKVLGSGGHGTVYKYDDMAYKIMTDRFSYIRELMCSQLGYILGGCIKLNKYDYNNNTLCYPVYNIDMHKWIHHWRCGIIDIDRRQLIIERLIICIAKLHYHDIIHGDLKPGNILFKTSSSGYLEEVILCDSGNLSSPHNFNIGNMTKIYRPPEKNASLALDIYSLGCIIVDLFTTYYKQDRTEQIKYLPKYWKGIAQKCLDPNPLNRPSIFYLHKYIYNQEITYNTFIASIPHIIHLDNNDRHIIQNHPLLTHFLQINHQQINPITIGKICEYIIYYKIIDFNTLKLNDTSERITFTILLILFVAAHVLWFDSANDFIKKCLKFHYGNNRSQINLNLIQKYSTFIVTDYHITYSLLQQI